MPLKGEDAPIHPGQLPTKKVTSELEPILPEWLREARKQARQSAQEEPTISGGDKQTKPLPQVPDLLAGLADQKEHEEEDETPDWLRTITGAPANKKKSEPESSQVKWVELGHNDEPAGAAPESESPVLPWMAGAEPAPEKDELSEWFKQASGSAPVAEQKPAAHDVQKPAPLTPEQSTPNPPAFPPGDVSEWMKDQGSYWTDSGDSSSEPPLSTETEVPDWIKRLDESKAVPDKPAAEPALPADVEIPDWIKKLDAQTPAAGQTPELGKETPALPPEATDVPDWLKSLDQESASPPLLLPSSP